MKKNRLGVAALLCFSSCVYHKVEEPVPNDTSITFSKNIRPLMINKCGSCHKEGEVIDFSVYENASSNIDLILYRVQLKPGAFGFMPQNSTPLTLREVNLLKQWQAEGLMK